MSEHKTTENFAKTGAFTVAFATEETGAAVGKAFSDGKRLK